MAIRALVKRLVELTGYTIQRKRRDQIAVYDQDGLRSVHNHEFVLDPSFIAAYERGLLAVGKDHHFRWRVHIALWAAFSASKLDGDFVECGVNNGSLSSAIMKFLDWNSLARTFYLLDTFGGLDERFVSDAEVKTGALERNKNYLETGFYVSDVESVRLNFSEWKNVRIIQGPVPETLDQVDTKKIAYLHLDMNCSYPEVAAMRFFWDRLVPGAFILMDDYAYAGYRSSKLGADSFAKGKGLMIASLPTGQGLLTKPP